MKFVFQFWLCSTSVVICTRKSFSFFLRLLVVVVDVAGFSRFVARNFHAMTFSCYLINLTFHCDMICKEKLAKFVISCLIGFICFGFSSLISILIQWENWFCRLRWGFIVRSGSSRLMGINFIQVKIKEFGETMERLKVFKVFSGRWYIKAFIWWVA